MFKLVVALAFVAVCSASYNVGFGINKNQYFVDAGYKYIKIFNQEGDYVDFAVDNFYGYNGPQKVFVQFYGQKIAPKTVQYLDQQTQFSGRYQSDILYQIFNNYDGSVDEVEYQKLLNIVSSYVQNGQLNPAILYALQALNGQYEVLNYFDQYQQQGQYQQTPYYKGLGFLFGKGYGYGYNNFNQQKYGMNYYQNKYDQTYNQELYGNYYGPYNYPYQYLRGQYGYNYPQKFYGGIYGQQYPEYGYQYGKGGLYNQYQKYGYQYSKGLFNSYYPQQYQQYFGGYYPYAAKSYQYQSYYPTQSYGYYGPYANSYQYNRQFAL